MFTSSLPQLQVFLTVARHKSFSGAARELGVSPSAVSQSIKQLEAALQVVLLRRTTRSVSPTEAGQRLIESATPALKQAVDALVAVSAKPGEVVGRLKLSVGNTAVPLVITPMLATFRARHPRIDLEIVVEDRLVDIVGEGYDAAVRLSEAIERDMVQVRLTEAFRCVVVGSPHYLAQHGTPKKPEDLADHSCIGFRPAATGALYAWELERGRRTWRVPMRGGLVTNDPTLGMVMCEQGLGLFYALELGITEQLRTGRVVTVLDAYAPTVPGYFLCFQSRAQSSPALRLFVDVAKEILVGQTARR